MSRPGEEFGSEWIEHEVGGLMSRSSLTQYMSRFKSWCKEAGLKEAPFYRASVDWEISDSEWGYVFDPKWGYFVLEVTRSGART